METAGGSSDQSAPGPIHDEQQAPEKRPACPKCGSPDIRRSRHDGVAAGLLRVFGRWPFRCRSCRSRFYRSAQPPEEE